MPSTEGPAQREHLEQTQPLPASLRSFLLDDAECAVCKACPPGRRDLFEAHHRALPRRAGVYIGLH